MMRKYQSRVHVRMPDWTWHKDDACVNFISAYYSSRVALYSLLQYSTVWHVLVVKLGGKLAINTIAVVYSTYSYGKEVYNLVSG